MPGICCPGAPVDPTSIEAADGDKRRCLVAVFAALLVEVAIADVDAAVTAAGATTPRSDMTGVLLSDDQVAARFVKPARLLVVIEA